MATLEEAARITGVPVETFRYAARRGCLVSVDDGASFAKAAAVQAHPELTMGEARKLEEMFRMFCNQQYAAGV